MTDPSSSARPGTPIDAHWPVFIARWFHENGRSLPWRTDPPNPYYVWLSEIMLQQTRIETVIPYFLRFIHDYPTIHDLASASLEDVLKHWEGLGYYSRARHLFMAATLIDQNPDGFPSDYASIRKLPGIGEYTAGAIASIAFGLPVPAIDGNVMRVVSRLYLLEEDVMKASSKRHVHELLEPICPKDTPGDFVQGLMELGETICLPASPDCAVCPLNLICQAYMNGRQEELPIRVPKVKRRTESIIVFLIHRGPQILLAKRPEDIVLGGLVELPNIPAGAELSGAFEEKYGLKILPGQPVKNIDHVFTHNTWHMQLIEGSLKEPLPDNLPEGLFLADEETLTDKIMLPTAFRKLLT